MYRRLPSGATAMPRGFLPKRNVDTTLSVAVSITEIVAKPSFGTYASGAAMPYGRNARAASATSPRRTTNAMEILREEFASPAPREVAVSKSGQFRAPEAAGMLAEFACAVNHGHNARHMRNPVPRCRWIAALAAAFAADAARTQDAAPALDTIV